MATPDTPRPQIDADPGVLLAQVGRALSEIPFEMAREGCAAELGRIGPELGLTHIDIWRFNRPSNRAEQLSAWAIGERPSADTVWTDVSVNERTANALRVGGGTATVPRRWIDEFGGLELGGETNQVVISIIDHEDGPEPDSTQTTVLIAVPAPRASLTLLSSSIADLSVLLKQYNRRVRIERRFAHLLGVERAIGAASLMLAESGVAAEPAAFDQVRKALGAAALMLARWHGGRDVELSAVSSPGIPIETPQRLMVPEMPGLDVDAAVARRFGCRSISETDGLISAALGADAEDAFGELGARRCVAMVPAGSSGRMSLGAVRHVDEPWDPSELDALTSFGAVVGQVRERDAAQGETKTRDTVDQFSLAFIGTVSEIDLAAAPAAIRAELSTFAELQGIRQVSVRWAGDAVLPPLEVGPAEATIDDVEYVQPITYAGEVTANCTRCGATTVRAATDSSRSPPHSGRPKGGFGPSGSLRLPHRRKRPSDGPPRFSPGCGRPT